MSTVAVLKPNPEGTEGEYTWTCPACGHTQPEWPEDQDFGQTVTSSEILCENCDAWFDYIMEEKA
jgi:hypothetical protein